MTSDHEPGGTEVGETAMGNLPPQLTELIGREDELREVSALVWRGRLLTLSGPGGAGKTRLAIALAEAIRADFVEGAWWVDLSHTMDPESVAQAIAATVLPAEPANGSASATIARRFPDSSLLLLDNCEQVVEGCTTVVSELLGSTQSLRVIATSREPLGVPGEQVWRVPGLGVSRPTSPSGGPVGDAAAVQLFVARAREVASSFDPDAPGVRDTVARICRWLGGMPLSIELAAARVSVLSVGEIAERLERGTGFLRHHSRTAPDRHRTLRDTLEWSHRMLEPAEQLMLRRLGVFRGSLSLAAAEAIVADELLVADDVLDLLSRLVARSMVQVVEGRDAPRYALLAPVRQYAAGKLRESGEASAVRQRHAAYFRKLAGDVGMGVDGDQIRALAQLELEHDNLAEALRWLLEQSGQEAIELASLLWPYWYQRGCYREARDAFEQVLASHHDLPLTARAQALSGAGEVAFLQCDYAVAEGHLRHGLELSRGLGDRRGVATALQRLGCIAREQARYDHALDLHTQSLDLWTELGDGHGVATSRNYLGFVAWLSADHLSAESLCSAALVQFRNEGVLQDVAGTLINLGSSALYRGELGLAQARLAEALAIARRLGFEEGIAWSLHELAIVGRQARQPLDERAPMLRDALLVHNRLGDRWRLASVLEELVGSVLAGLDPCLAVSILACSEALRAELGAPIPVVETPDYLAVRSRLQHKLSRRAFAEALSEGRELTREQAVDRVLEAIARLDQNNAGPTTHTITPILTPRELAVLELVAKGLTNREIGASLYMSPSTAGVHVSNILRKLGAKRRVDAAGLAQALGLVQVR